MGVHFCLVCGFETEDETVAYDHDCMKASWNDPDWSRNDHT